MLAIQNTPVPYPPADLSESQATAGREWRMSMGLSDIQFVPAKSPSTLGNNIESKFKPISDDNLPSTPSSAKGKGKAINLQDDALKTPVRNAPAQSSPTTNTASPSSPANDTPTRKLSNQSKRLYTGPLPMTWPPSMKPAKGLSNLGNTCFLNSVLQCLFHTPPLLHMLIQHKECNTPIFCMSCTLRNLGGMIFRSSPQYAISPFQIVKSMHHFAKDLRRGRQEDAHEFLRYTIDALQKSCLVGLPKKLNPKIAETTWVHQIFGGKLRSRVTCKKCQYNSDTFDSYLDLSLELLGSKTVEQALASFVKPEILGEEHKYKCEKCKVPVVAVKHFTIHETPKILTIHLKRFTMSGRKISRFIEYPEHLDLSPYVSDGQFGHKYSLYGIISHSGGGPHSGHYIAHVKTSSGKWFEMNDDMTSSVGNKPPLDESSAYVLFYTRDGASDLSQAISFSPEKTKSPGKKRGNSDDEEEETTSSPQKRLKESSPSQEDILQSKKDAARAKIEEVKRSIGSKASSVPQYPASALLAQRINAAKQMASKASPSVSTSEVQAVGSTSSSNLPKPSLVDYAGDDDTDQGEPVPRTPSSSKLIGPQLPSSPTRQAESIPTPFSETALPSETRSSPEPPSKPLPTNGFYGSSASSSQQKRKSSGNGSDSHDRQRSRPRPGFHPYATLGTSNLYKKKADDGVTDGKGAYISKNLNSHRKGIMKNMKPKPRSLM
ncbi:hypothetical protein FRC03_006578 [Tulasnella sp. 419]|nr:hypothetical protein FRC03_006578 [Tulasnella sp. 419]